MRPRLTSILALAAFVSCSPSPDQISPDMTIGLPRDAVQTKRLAHEILESFAYAWRGDEEFLLNSDMTIGVWVDGTGYTIELTNDGASFVHAEPSQFDWGFETDLETLQRMDDGSLNALTAMGQARASDSIPLDIRLPDNFSDDDKVRSYYIPLTLHFWNREWPETVLFGDGLTRSVHGANTTVLVYDQGLRTAWYQLRPGMHINADQADQINDFDTAIVVTRGSFGGRVNGIERAFREGETVLIPAGVAHEFYADDSEYGEFVILMWGENA